MRWLLVVLTASTLQGCPTDGDKHPVAIAPDGGQGDSPYPLPSDETLVVDPYGDHDND